jgi:hypothetical protein
MIGRTNRYLNDRINNLLIRVEALESNPDSNVSWSESQAPSSINKSYRAALANMAMWIDDKPAAGRNGASRRPARGYFGTCGGPQRQARPFTNRQRGRGVSY